MKKKKYDWPKRCLSLICVLVLVSMIILQSVPVTYASENDEILQSLEQSANASEPEENSQMISTTETLPDEGTQTGTQLVNDIFQEGNTESSSGLQTDGNYEEPSNNISGAETSDNTSGNGEQGTDSNFNIDQNNGVTDDQDIANEIQSGENPEDSEGAQPDTESHANPEQENEDIWRNSIASAVLSNDYAKDLTALARTQLGVQENRDNFITTAEGVNHYYSRYGQWAGDSYEEWSAAFVNFCIHYANIPQQYLPKSENVSQWIQQLEAMSLHISKEGYTPKEGDLVFFLTNEHAEGNSQIQTETPAHAGIVTGADEQSLYTIEGNCGGMVQEETYIIGSDNIYGYLDMDQVKKLAGVLPEEPANPETPTDSQSPADSETPSETDTVKPEENNGEENPDKDSEDPEDNKDEEKSDTKPTPLEWKNEDVTITTEELTEGAISEGTTLDVVPVEQDKNETAFLYAEVESELQKKAENEDYEIAGFLAYDIHLVNAEGEEYEPEGKVKVSIQYNSPTLPELKGEADQERNKNEETSDSEMNVTIMHLKEDNSGNITEVIDLSKENAEENLIRNIETEGNHAITNVEFTADSFSSYAITWTYTGSNYIKDVQENKLTEERYKQYLQTMLASVEGTANGNLPITDWKRSSGYVNADLNLTTSATADSTINSNWWNTVSGLDTSITNADDVWDGSRNQTHEFTGYLPDKTVTVYNGALYDSATWKDHHNGDNNGSVYRFQGTFNIGADDPNDCTYTIQQVTGNDKLYINDDMWVFIYPEGTSITSSNYMDYLAFWTGTRNQNSSVKYFNDRLGTVATKDGEASKLSGLTKLTDGWNMVSVTDNAGAIIQSVYNKGNHATNYVIDVFAEDYNTGGGTYRLTVNKQKQTKATVRLKKIAANGGVPLSGAIFAVDDSSNSVHYTAVSGDDGMLTFNLLNGKTYTLSEVKAPDGYKKAANRWTIVIDENGGYTIKDKDTGEEVAKTDNVYYITNNSSVTVVTEKTLSHEKYIKYNPDTEDYDLTLNVSGAVGSSTTQYDLDVIFVLDTSGSMANVMSSSDSTSKISCQNEAVKNALEILNKKTNVNKRYAAVDFDTKAGIRCNWTTDSKTLTSQLSTDTRKYTAFWNSNGQWTDENSAGGTNYEDALVKTGSLLETSRPEATTMVIFISDGNPTFYNYPGDISKVNGNGQSDSDGKALKAANNILEGLPVNYFYKIGIGGTPSEYSNLNNLNQVPKGTVTAAAYEGTSRDALQSAIDEIISEATELLCTNVTITDTLSDYAQLVSGSDLTVKVKKLDESGNPVDVTQLAVPVSDTQTEMRPVENVVKATTGKTANGKTQIKLSFDPPSYKLESGYTYYVTAKIKATDKAYKDFEANGYIHKGDPFTDENTGENKKPGNDTVNTGTSSNKGGFYANDSAEVTYIYNKEEKNETYPKPVIQVKKDYKLPSAGGIGTYPFTIGGAAVLGTALLLFINNKRKEEVSER